MKIERLFTTEDPEVRTVSRAITAEELATKEMQEFLDELVVAMLKYDGIGIAAPQVGFPVQAIVIAKEYSKTDEHLVLINPRVASASKRTAVMEEGCLSVPGIVGPVERPVKARIKAWDRNGEPLDIKAKGMYARVLQHEVDHLNAILFIDKALEQIPVTGDMAGAAI